MFGILTSQYADDTSLILDGSEISLKEAIVELNSFKNISGLKLNIDKTQVIWIGSKKYSGDTLLPELKLKWGNAKFTLLGIEFSVDLHEIPKLNYDKKLIKLKSIIKSWSKRSLTPIGRIHLIKSLMISQFNNLFMSLPNPDNGFLNDLNSTLYHFLWNSSNNKIKRDIVTQDYCEGGLKMVDIRFFVDSLKLSWIKRLYRTTAKWQIICETYADIHMLSTCGNEYIRDCYNKCKNKFWKDVFKAWMGFNEKVRMKIKGKNIWNTPIWFNKDLVIGKKSIFYKTWYDKGVIIINDLFKDFSSGTFHTFEDFNQIYSVNTNFLQYRGVVSAVKTFLARSEIEYSSQHFPSIPSNIEYIIRCKTGTKDLYNILARNCTIPTGRKRWEEKLELDDLNWGVIYKNCFRATKNTKLQWFQYRIVHHILTTNSFMFKLGLLNNPFCTFCNLQRETIIHIMWECPEVQKFLESLEVLLEALPFHFHLTKEVLFLGSLLIIALELIMKF